MITCHLKLTFKICFLFFFVLNLNTFAADKRFRFRISGEPETLDWNRAHTTVETYLLMNLMEGLVEFNSRFVVIPSLAKRWELSRDGLTYTFYLKAGVQWSDGNTMSAGDFVYSWKRLLSPLTAASYAYVLFDIEGAEEFHQGKMKDFSKVGIKAIDSLTFQVKLKRPIAHWIYIPTFWVTFPMREDIVEKYGNSWAKPGRMKTLGPFTYFAHEEGRKIILKRNPKYDRTRGNITEVVAIIENDETEAMNLYEAGGLDLITGLSTLSLSRLMGRRDLVKFPYLKVGYLGFNVKKHPVDNPRVRRALAKALNKSKIKDFLFGGQVQATSFVPGPLLGFHSSLGHKYDPEVSKRALKYSGTAQKRFPPLRLIIHNWEKEKALAKFIKSEFKRILRIEVIVLPFDNQSYQAQIELGNYDLFIGRWGADYPDPENFLAVFTSSSGNNRTGWKSTIYDELISRGKQDNSARSRQKIYFEAQRLLLEQDTAVIPLYYEPNTVFISNRVKGLNINPLNYLFLRNVHVR